MTKGWHQNFKVAPAIERTGPDGFVYDSKTEYQWWCVLNLRQRAGEIRDLARQMKFDLVIKGQHVGDYTADFMYEERQKDGTWLRCIDDTKGFHDSLSKLRIKVFECLYDETVRIVKKDGRGKNFRWVIE